MRFFTFFFYLIVITNPYEDIDYSEINTYIIEEKDYSIDVYESGDPKKQETIFTQVEIDRFIQKADSIINDYDNLFDD